MIDERAWFKGKQARPSEEKRKKGLQIRRRFALVQCLTMRSKAFNSHCNYFKIVKRSQKYPRCPRCKKRMWLNNTKNEKDWFRSKTWARGQNIKLLAYSNHYDRIRKLVPWYCQRVGSSMPIPVLGDIDAHLDHAQGQSELSNFGERLGEPSALGVDGQEGYKKTIKL